MLDEASRSSFTVMFSSRPKSENAATGDPELAGGGLDARAGLLTRAGLLASIEATISSEAGTLMLVDLTGCGNVNDTRGPSTGDDILRQSAQRLRLAVDERGISARLATDAFAILLPRLTDTFDATRVGDELLSTFDAPFDVESEEVQLGINIGVAIGPQHGAGAEELLASADLALQRSKARRASGYLFFTPRLRKTPRTRRTARSGTPPI